VLWARMRNVAWAFSMCVAVAGCGGSSSETPPPLEPDPTSFRYTGPRMPATVEATAAAPEAEVSEPPSAAVPGKAAAPTWGSGKPAPTPAPSLTAPKPAP
jgi:hypothetical protein